MCFRLIVEEIRSADWQASTYFWPVRLFCFCLFQGDERGRRQSGWCQQSTRHRLHRLPNVTKHRRQRQGNTHTQSHAHSQTDTLWEGVSSSRMTSLLLQLAGCVFLVCLREFPLFMVGLLQETFTALLSWWGTFHLFYLLLISGASGSDLWPWKLWPCWLVLWFVRQLREEGGRLYFFTALVTITRWKRKNTLFLSLWGVKGTACKWRQ